MRILILDREVALQDHTAFRRDDIVVAPWLHPVQVGQGANLGIVGHRLLFHEVDSHEYFDWRSKGSHLDLHAIERGARLRIYDRLRLGSRAPRQPLVPD